MTEQPRTPKSLHVQRFDDAMVYHVKAMMGATIPDRPYSRGDIHCRGRCEQCSDWSLWSFPNEPMLCGHHAALAAYRNLPWWRRALTRKPKP